MAEEKDLAKQDNKKQDNIQPKQVETKTVNDDNYQRKFKISFPEDIPEIPEAKDPTKIDVRYTIIEPYVKIHIYWVPENNELQYDIEEPELTDDEKEKLKILEEGLNELINISFINIDSEDKIIEFIEKNLLVIIDEFGIKITEKQFLKFMYYIYRDFIGLNEMEPLMHDYFIEDIECNGFESPVYIVHRKYSNLKTNLVYPKGEKLVSFVEKLAQKAGQYVSYANPLLDGVLPDGSRVNATYTEDVSSKGPSVTIRKFTKEPWTPIKLMDVKTVAPEILAYLWLLIENRSNILVIGGTGSGKTSFLNSMAFFIPPASRVVSIEDTRELQLKHENWLPSVSRQGMGSTTITGEKHGEVSLFDLLKESLRQRPDYILVGEIRGQEAFVLFQAMASGHPSYATMHAESVDTMINRLTTPPINLSAALVETLDAVCIMIPAKVNGKDVRKLREITEIVNVKGKKVVTNTPFIWDPKDDKFKFKTASKIFEKIMKRSGMNWNQILKEFKIRTELLMVMYRKKEFDFAKVQEIIHEYAKAPNKVLERYGIKI